ncbi:hypothetical protein P43SY_007728 [Pythium insidiosum]|uniref:TIR domain-containing protein n=1 Tax=Pythium insidiosum TaxID=114742 RepID=A0AAD5LLN9_PYTIN|nr:hypothetical protein P43SY_007728 [Pythium insidiosum]
MDDLIEGDYSRVTSPASGHQQYRRRSPALHKQDTLESEASAEAVEAALDHNTQRLLLLHDDDDETHGARTPPGSHKWTTDDLRGTSDTVHLSTSDLQLAFPSVHPRRDRHFDADPSGDPSADATATATTRSAAAFYEYALSGQAILESRASSRPLYRSHGAPLGGSSTAPAAAESADADSAHYGPHARFHNGAFQSNSYFAIRLLRLMQLIVVLDLVAIGCFFAWRRDDGAELSTPDANGASNALFVESPLTAVFTSDDGCTITISLAALLYFLFPAVVVLGLPASGVRCFEPFKRERRVSKGGRLRKVKRTIFLQCCEMTAVLLFVYLGVLTMLALYYVVVTKLFDCPNNPSAVGFGLGAVVVYALMYLQARYFTRFREHLKMQLGAFSEGDQTGGLKAHVLRAKMQRRRRRAQQQRDGLAQQQQQNPLEQKEGTPLEEIAAATASPPPPPRKQVIAFVRKRLFRGAQLGDLRLLHKTLKIARRHLGDGFAREMYPDASIVWWVSFSKKNPLHVAAYHGNIAAMELLYRANFEINSFDKVSRVRISTGDIFWNLARYFFRQPVVSTEDAYGAGSMFKSTLVTPLHCAVCTGRVDAVRWLIEHGADVNLCSRSSQRAEARLPAIFVADHPEIVKQLLTAGANQLVIPDPGHMNTITVLQLAYLRGNYAVAQVLENWGGDVALTPLHTAAAMNNTNRIRHYLRRRVNPDCLGELGYVGLNKRTPLHWAAVNGAIQAVEMLLDANANPNFADARGRTPLHWAARVNRVEVVKILLHHGADPNIVDEGGMTPLLCAACAGGTTPEMFKALVSRGANINHQLPATGDTALHIAVKLDDQQTAVALLSVGGDIMRMNHDGLRPIDCTTSTRLQFEIKRAAGNRDVMISYTHSHKEFALKLRKSLEDANITTWLDVMDPSGIGGGAVWREEIARGVTNAAVVMCILTDDYAQSQWCMKELALAKQVGTPIMAISTEHAHISEELQVYLYTRQIVPFEDAITSIDHVNEKEICYTYDELAYKRQLQLLLDGLRDEIEKRKEEIVRKNLHRLASGMTTMLTTSTPTAFDTSGMTGSILAGHNGSHISAASRALHNRTGSALTSRPNSHLHLTNPMQPFDERTPVMLMQEQSILDSDRGAGTAILRQPGRPKSLTAQAAMNRWNLRRRHANDSTLSSSSSTHGQFPEDLSNSIILDANGYYVHQTQQEQRVDQQLHPRASHMNGSILETVREVKQMTAEGECFVFICHGDHHGRFVKRLCAALCRDGGLHCFVDRRHRSQDGISSSPLRMDDLLMPSPRDPPSSSGSTHGPVTPMNDDDQQDMLARIHEAKEAILKCSAFVLILSEKTIRSQLVKDQLAFAEDKGKRILPVVVNRLEFSLDMQYSLSRSQFFHFFSSGDMIGFDRSVSQVLAALREEMFGISVEPETTPTTTTPQTATTTSTSSRLPKVLSYDRLGSLLEYEDDDSSHYDEQRHRQGSGQSAQSTQSSWLEAPLTLRLPSHNLSMLSAQSGRQGRSGSAGSSSSAPVSSSRPLTTDLSLHQSMMGNFTSLMRHMNHDDDEDHSDDGEVDDEDDDDFFPELTRAVSDGTYDDTDALDIEDGLALSSVRRQQLLQGSFVSRRRMSSIMSNSNASVSMLECRSEDDTKSVDAIKPAR